MRETGLPTVVKKNRALFQGKNVSELCVGLSRLVQAPNEEPQRFLLRALNLREKILFCFKTREQPVKLMNTYASLWPHSHDIGFILYHILDPIRYRNFILFTLLRSAPLHSHRFMFLHALETGLISNNLRSNMRGFNKTTHDRCRANCTESEMLSWDCVEKGKLLLSA